jgi:hypothetical protein
MTPTSCRIVIRHVAVRVKPMPTPHLLRNCSQRRRPARSCLPRTGRLFDDGELTDEGFRNQLELLGSEVVRAARQMRATGTYDYELHKRRETRAPARPPDLDA